MEHVLDNPAWSALIGGNSPMAFGNERVKYFDREISPFVAFKNNSVDGFKELYEVIPHTIPLLFVSTIEIEIPELWKVLNPDHLGNGYARQTLLYQIHRIKAIGETPFLHVRYDNERAIQVYESLGFATRTEVYFYVLQKQ